MKIDEKNTVAKDPMQNNAGWLADAVDENYHALRLSSFPQAGVPKTWNQTKNDFKYLKLKFQEGVLDGWILGKGADNTVLQYKYGGSIPQLGFSYGYQTITKNGGLTSDVKKTVSEDEYNRDYADLPGMRPFKPNQPDFYYTLDQPRREQLARWRQQMDELNVGEGTQFLGVFAEMLGGSWCDLPMAGLSVAAKPVAKAAVKASLKTLKAGATATTKGGRYKNLVQALEVPLNRAKMVINSVAGKVVDKAATRGVTINNQKLAEATAFFVNHGANFTYDAMAPLTVKSALTGETITPRQIMTSIVALGITKGAYSGFGSLNLKPGSQNNFDKTKGMGGSTKNVNQKSEISEGFEKSMQDNLNILKSTTHSMGALDGGSALENAAKHLGDYYFSGTVEGVLELIQGGYNSDEGAFVERPAWPQKTSGGLNIQSGLNG